MLTQEQQKKHDEIVKRRNVIFNKANSTVMRNVDDNDDEDYGSYIEEMKNISERKKGCGYY
jgi:hypothetical protein